MRCHSSCVALDPTPARHRSSLNRKKGRWWSHPSTVPGPIVVVVLSVLLAGSFILSAVLLSQRARTQTASVEPVGPAYQMFWSRFVTGSAQPWVIFSNGSFVGRPETGMRYFNRYDRPAQFHSRSLHGRRRSSGDPSTRSRLLHVQSPASGEARSSFLAG